MDKILVIVNDEIITQGEVDRILLPIYAQFRGVFSGQELATKLDEARKHILQRLVHDKVLLSEARRREIEVTDEEVEEKLEEVRKGFKTEEEFREAMEKESIIISDLEKKYKERIMIDKLINSEIRKRVSVSPNEIADYYENNKDLFREPARLRLRSILIKITGERPEDDAKNFATRLFSRLKGGSDFELLARRYSDGPYAENGGDMGWVKEGELMEKINDTVFRLRSGEVSGIIKTKLGFHIFKVEERIPARMKDFAEAKDEIEKRLFNQKTQENLGQWLEKLKQDAYIAFR